MAHKGKKPEQKTGTFFPVDPKGARSTTFGGKEAIAAAMRGAGEPLTAEAAAKCSNRKWRFGYNKHYMSLVKACAASPDASLGAAKAGLDYMHSNFEHVAAEGEAPKKFKDMLAAEKGSYSTGVVKGTAPKAAKPYMVPYDGGWSPSAPQAPPSGAVLSGAALKDRTTAWVKGGIMEPDAAAGVNWTVDYFDSGKDLSGCYFVLIGAGSAMGPFAKLLEHGANVVAIDIPGKWGERPAAMWTRLFTAAKQSSGQLIYPKDPAVSDPAASEEAQAGCDLMSSPGQIANWLVQWQATLPAGARVAIGNYTYLDGDLHVKLALCADACIAALRRARPSTAVAFLCTPTDIHAVPQAAHDAARRAGAFWHKGWLFEKAVQALSVGKALKGNAPRPVPTGAKSAPLCLVDGLSVAQGPNYALAKRVQHWRAQIAFEEGATVSSMVAPSTATVSVIHNKTFAWAYGGMPHFGYEIFKQETTNAVMAALLMHDVLNDAGPKNPKNRAKFGVANSLELFKSQSVHGGLWRSPYTVDSLGEASVIIYFLGGPKLFLPVLALLLAAAAFAVNTYLM